MSLSTEQLQKIKQLDELRASGTLTDAEYETAKARVTVVKENPPVEPAKPEPKKSSKKSLIVATVVVLGFVWLMNIIAKPSHSATASLAAIDTETSMGADSILASAGSTENAKVSAAEVEQARVTVKRLRPLMRYKKDDFNGGWFHAKSSPRFTNYNGIYSYFNYLDDKTGPSNLRFAIQYVAEDWLFIERYRFLIGGKEYVYIPDDIKRDNGDGEIWEWSDESVNSSSQEIIDALIQAKSGKVRFEGKDYYKDKAITANQIADLKRVSDLYAALNVIHNN